MSYLTIEACMIIINGRKIKSSIFPGGEVHVNLEGMFIENINIVIAYLYSSDDVMKLMLTVDAMRRENPKCYIELEIPYFPYGRQDRVCSKGEAFSLEVMCKMINGLECNVIITDPHSEKTAELLDNCKVETQEDIFQENDFFKVIQEKNLILVSPDAGASEKVRYLSEKYRIDAIYCTKKRDPKTGYPVPVLPNGADYRGINFIVIDDICDGGRTFVNLGHKLKECGAGHLYLYVTHGIFSQGFSALRTYYDRIYCNHTFNKPSEHVLKHNLTIFKTSQLNKGEI